MRRALVLLIGAAGLYLAALWVGGWALGGAAARRVEARLADALDAEVRVGGVSLGLVRGELVVRDVVIERRTGGHLDLHLDEVTVDVAPLGLVIVDRDVERAVVRGVRMELSARGAVELHARRRPGRPLPIGELELRDARLVAMPTAVLPRLGRIEVEITSARARGFALRDGLSWLAGLTALDGRVEVAGVGVGAGYDGQTLRLSGRLLGSRTLAIAFTPPASPDGYELAWLAALAGALADEVKDQARDAVVDRLRGLVD